jgi:TIR domain
MNAEVLLAALFHHVRGNPANLAPMFELGKAVGLTMDETKAVVEQLSDEGSVSRVKGYRIALTAAGRTRAVGLAEAEAEARQPLPEGGKGAAARSVFISYCQSDRPWCNRLLVHLRPLVRDGVLDVWHDGRLESGDDWPQQIRDAIDRAGQAVLLVSPGFLASEFIHYDELPPLLAAGEQRGLRIRPLNVSSSNFERSSLAHFQMFNPKKPLDQLRPAKRNEVLANLARTIAAAVR